VCRFSSPKVACKSDQRKRRHREIRRERRLFLSARYRTGIGRFRSCLDKGGMGLGLLSAACEYSAEEQTVDHVVLNCSIH